MSFAVELCRDGAVLLCCPRGAASPSNALRAPLRRREVLVPESGATEARPIRSESRALLVDRSHRNPLAGHCRIYPILPRRLCSHHMLLRPQWPPSPRMYRRGVPAGCDLMGTLPQRTQCKPAMVILTEIVRVTMPAARRPEATEESTPSCGRTRRPSVVCEMSAISRRFERDLIPYALENRLEPLHPESMRYSNRKSPMPPIYRNRGNSFAYSNGRL